MRILSLPVMLCNLAAGEPRLPGPGLASLTPMCMRNVLGVLEDPPERLWSTFTAAVELAAAERARLTLVKTRHSGRLLMWCAPFAVGGLYVPPDEDPALSAGAALARAAACVPADIPVTSFVLGTETQRDLRRLVASGDFDALVASRRLLERARRLVRDCARAQMSCLPAPARPAPALLSPVPATSGSAAPGQVRAVGPQVARV